MVHLVLLETFPPLNHPTNKTSSTRYISQSKLSPSTPPFLIAFRTGHHVTHSPNRCPCSKHPKHAHTGRIVRGRVKITGKDRRCDEGRGDRDYRSNISPPQHFPIVFQLNEDAAKKRMKIRTSEDKWERNFYSPNDAISEASITVVPEL